MNSLEYWLQQIEAVHPQEIELGLTRVATVASNMDLLNCRAKVVMIAGTNGKGSCAATLEATALTAASRVGCYTSPHLLKFNERIRINGDEVSDNHLIEAFTVIDQAREAIALTFFEYTTLAALWLFSKQTLDLIILEVGLGGRLDAVNIMHPDVAIVTSIDLDHQAWLTSDLTKIAYEKSGIFCKNTVNLVGDKRSYDLILKARPTFSQSIELVVPLATVNQMQTAHFDRPAYQQFKSEKHLKDQNADLAITAFCRLFDRRFQTINFSQLSGNYYLKGRFQTLFRQPLTILDVAHNPQSVANLACNLSRLTKDSERYAICGMMEDKAIQEMLKILKPQIQHWVFVDLACERAATAKQLSLIWREISNVKAVTKHDVANAYRSIIQNCGENAQIVVFGSFITVAAMLQYAIDNQSIQS